MEPGGGSESDEVSGGGLKIRLPAFDGEMGRSTKRGDHDVIEDGGVGCGGGEESD